MFGPFLINVVAGITELWVENSQNINYRDTISIREGRVTATKPGNPLLKNFLAEKSKKVTTNLIIHFFYLSHISNGFIESIFKL